MDKSILFAALLATIISFFLYPYIFEDDFILLQQDNIKIWDGMKLIHQGIFLMGSNSEDVYPSDGEGPVREVLHSKQ